MNYQSRWTIVCTCLVLLSLLGVTPGRAQNRKGRTPIRSGSASSVAFTGPVLQLAGAHISVKLPEGFTVKEKASDTTALVMSPTADWALNVGSLGEAKSFDEAMVGMLSVITRAFRPDQMSESAIKKLPNGMASKEFTGVGFAESGGVAWTAHIIQVREKQFALTLAVFNVGQKDKPNLKKNLGLYLQIVSKITPLD